LDREYESLLVPQGKGAEFLLVDPAQSATKPAFDHVSLAAALSREAKHDYKPTELPFDTFDFSDDGKSIRFQMEAAAWSCNLETYECKHEPGSGPYEDASHNKEWIAFVKDYNLFVRYVPTGEIVQLTRDGEPGWDYATEIASLRPMVTQGTQDLKQRPSVFWFPDFSKLVTYRMDTRSAGRFTNLQFVPPGQLRPRAFTVVYPLPGEVLPKAEPIIFNVQKGKRVEVKTAPLEVQFQGGPGFDWFPDTKGFYYQAEDR
jgi:dipeptidyl-peptidase-4